VGSWNDWWERGGERKRAENKDVDEKTLSVLCIF
jgi:hypothetical protein